MLHVIILLCIYNTDKRIKSMLYSGIKQTSMLKQTSRKYFFVCYRRKEGLISKHAFVCMIIHYILNTTGFALLFIQFITRNNISMQITCSILLFLNIGMIIPASLQPALTSKQELLLKEYMDKERWRQEDERKKKKYSAKCENGKRNTSYESYKVDVDCESDCRLQKLHCRLQERPSKVAHIKYHVDCCQLQKLNPK